MNSSKVVFAGSLTNHQGQCCYLHFRVTESIANAVDKIWPMSARYALTNSMVRHSRALVKRDRAAYDIVPLPAIEAVSNQFFALSLNDARIFVHLLRDFYMNEYSATNEVESECITKNAADQIDVDLQLFHRFDDIRDLETCADQINLNEIEKARLAVQKYLLSETIHFVKHDICV